MVLEGRHIYCISALLCGSSSNANAQQQGFLLGEGLVEPISSTAIPSHIVCARALCKADDQGVLPLQIFNGSQKSITLHQGTKLANFYPCSDIYVVDIQRHAPTSRGTPSPTRG